MNTKRSKAKPDRFRDIRRKTLSALKPNPDPKLTDWKLCCFIRDLPNVLKNAKRKKLGHVVEVTENLIRVLSGTDQDKQIFCTLGPSVNGTDVDLRIEPDPPKVPKYKMDYARTKFRHNPEMEKVLKTLKADK